MRIISKEKDYYDAMLLAMSSSDLVWTRKTDHRKKVLASDLGFNIGDLPHCKNIIYLFFCGKIYPFTLEYTGYGQLKLIFWSFKDWDSYLKSDKQKGYRYLSDLDKQCFDVQQTHSRLIEKIQKESGVAYFLFEPLKASVTYYQDTAKPLANLTIYPNLSSIGFNKIKSAVEVAQEVDYYLGNVLVSDTIIEPVSDEVKLLAHGYDKKLSFRGHSGKGNKKASKNIATNKP